ncbi:hypothetical protein PFMALIP_05911 [Plasmodium falciparum MaliPS096_E11]|uniref:Duffy-binding-like domain-containing protein n=1 Tax=Plasmodium falciparum MaliPS096_E11 TaxID=1036727 RepID=A0A024WH62_PLAFA|nr:hypothetical protein PFMALIP_05911 [Plasmodium falciparum MaliPS096_E11]
MGSQSSKSSQPSVVTNESEKSARNEKKKVNGYTSQLRGYLSRATFCDAFCDFVGIRNYGYSDPCYLDHRFYTNIKDSSVEGRNPCNGREKDRFGENAESYCNSDKIRDNGIKSAGGACAPPRRRHICDKNLEALTVANTKNSNDLLGNILVTAKYEGESIVRNHPNKETSDVCTALARSFADIGDIVRGRDMFKRNEEDAVQKGLRAVFKNIHENLRRPAKSHYADGDKSGNYYKLREAWWTVNRDQVWKAITCKAPKDANYFTKESDGTLHFSSHGKCGHNEGDPPTDLDYVPQYLRWFEEWAEEFCRKKKIKLENVEKACRDDSKNLYCSHNGYDCTKTIRNENILSDDPKCNSCLAKCSLYDIWLRNQRNEFEKQKEIYTKEIQIYLSNKKKSSSSINNEYYKDFYEELKKNEYETGNKFLLLLNEGKFCNEKLTGKRSIDFSNDVDNIFSHSKHCKVCPHCGVDCNNGTCKDRPNKGNCGKNLIYDPPSDVKPTKITVLYSSNEKRGITEKLKDFCTKSNKENEKNYQKWECYYKSSGNNKCQMTGPSQKVSKHRDVMKFDEFFHFWVTNFLIDSIEWENELTNCINNTTMHCNDKCTKNCVCFDKWVKQKEQEWNSIKKLFTKEKKMPENYRTNINYLFEFFFFLVMYKLKKEAKWKELMDELRNKIELSKEKEGTKDLQDAIELLLDHLKETATICKDNNTNEACEDSKKETQNPCGDKRGAKHRTVKQIAQYYKRIAHKQLNERGSRSALKGDASKGKYRRQGNPRKLKKVCRIAKDHSNRNHKDSRGRHLCTSNLEYLINGNHKEILKVKNGKINHSFLGDVLLAAKMDAEKIKNVYKEQNGKKDVKDLTTPKDHQSICRAVRYSFADLGDIIKGTDLWVHPYQTQLQGDLKTIFGKIKDKDKVKLNGKYTNDSKHTQLRKDWWEANRDQVWKAMTCPKSGITCGSSDHTPLHDYIPQRLRWLTEWAEWYCKEQKEAYEKLVTGCTQCKNKGGGKQCMNDDNECKTCKEACAEYKTKIERWQKQWETISKKYEELYGKAKNYSDNAKKDTKDKDDYVLKFLKQLHKENGGDKSGNTTYSTAAGYVHQEAHIDDCNKQNVFCETKSADNNNYAFRPQPHDHDTSCSCEEREKRDEICQMVKTLLYRKENDYRIEGCNRKKDRPWDCENNIDPKYTGACMPPRRQALCIFNLRFSNKMQDKEQMRKEFINCAATEIHFLWKYYTEKDSSARIELNKGTIPKNFMRWMEYTFSDYRDLFFETDISNHEYIIAVKNNVNNVLSKSSSEKKFNLNNIKNEWWQKHGPEIWMGMLCALTNGIDNTKEKNKIMEHPKYKVPPEEFAEIPQFLRWMIEWSEHFCKEQKKMYTQLVEGCKECTISYGTVTTDDCKKKCKQCKQECEVYKDFVQKWLPQWTQQSGKYSDLYQKAQTPTTGSTEEEKPVVQYLSELLKKSGNSDGADTTFNSAGKYVSQKGYIRDCDTQNKFDTSDSNNYAFREKPYDHEQACSCQDPPKSKNKEQTCEIVKQVLSKTKNDQGGIDGCNPKNGEYPSWDCKRNKSHVKNSGACIPPRRRKFCVSLLAKDGIFIKDEEDIRETFVKSAALETYFSWKRYKKDNREAEDELKSGKIPGHFKRQMYYTFGDYRDIFFGTDITSHNYILDVSENAKKKLKEKNGEKKSFTKEDDTKLLEDWWDKHGKEIWEGMLCALTHGVKENDEKKKILEAYSYEELNKKTNSITPLEEFAEKPQFLRWMIEWSEHFCKKQSQEYNDLKRTCTGCNEGTCEKECETCKDQCRKYQEIITQWKGQWTIQSNKYQQLYTKAITKGFNGTVDETEKKYLEYLKELKNLNGNNNEYSTAGKYVVKEGYIEDCQEQKEFGNEDDIKYAFSNYPNDHKNKCNCKKKETPLSPPKKPEAPPPSRPPPRLPAARDSEHDHRARSEDGENGAARPRSPKPGGDGGLGRILPGVDRSTKIFEDSDSDSDSEGDDDSGEDEGEEEGEEELLPEEEAEEGEGDEGEQVDEEETAEEEVEDKGDDEESEEEEEEEAPAEEEEQQKEEACNIVEKLFEKNDKNDKYFNDACSLKYSHGKEQFTQWKCINDTTSSPSDKETLTTSPSPTSTCIPPRRQKLYVGKLHTLNDLTPLGLRTAFIESAAIETFFSWHKFKKDKEKKKKKPENGAAALLLQLQEEDDDDEKKEKDPQELLKTGDIPEEFKRQMFYTFGDYKDIFFGKDAGNGKDLGKDSDTTSISDKIVSILKADSQPPSGKPQDKREEWWNQNAHDIWDGMICALSYDNKDKIINIDQDVRKYIIRQDGKINNKYDYNTIKISSTPISGDKKLTTTSTLSDFAKKPQFIRWFEEWAEEFCRKREYKLKKAKKECRSDKPGREYCDGEGHDCKLPDESRNNSFLYLKCPGCQKECIKYKKWIVNKRNEFNKQKKKFENEINNLDSKDHNKYDQEVCKNLKKMYPSFKDFVGRLNETPYCSKNNLGPRINFSNNGETFGISEYCKACPVYGVTYNRTLKKYESISEATYKKTKGIGENENNSVPTEIKVLVLDRKEQDNNKGHISECNNASLFEEASFQNWECQKKNRVEQCKLKNYSGDIDDDQEMEFNVFFQQWLRYFVYDYNKFKDKIKTCIKKENAKSNKCIVGCKENLECVQKWLDIKEKEWTSIKSYYETQKQDGDYGIPHWVKSYFVEQLYFDKDHEEAKKVVDEENKRDGLWGCTGNITCDTEEDQKELGDFITNLIKELQKKIGECKSQHSGKPPQTSCEMPPLSDDENPEPLDPDDNHHHHIQQPKFCPPPPVPETPLTCVERAAQILRKEAEDNAKTYDTKLKGDGTKFKSECNKVKKNNAALNGNDSCNFEKTYETSLKYLKETCNNNGMQRFKIGQTWNCVKIRKIGKDLCIPPRKKDMCIKNFKNITSRNVTNSTELLLELQEVAQNEGDYIIKKLLPENTCNEHVICDAMKYSFADLGDIIRGRDLWNQNIKPRIQTRLEYIFGNIYKSLKGENEKKYKDDFPLYYKLRSDWWDVNRKDIWNSMTCNAPDNAKLNKRNEEPKRISTDGSFVSTLENCGYNKEPPDYDYIPQPFRWMQEWSENFCKLLNKEMEQFQKKCNECKNNGTICKSDSQKCEKCKTQCEKYRQIVHEWQKQFGKYKETYDYLYNNNINTDNNYNNEYFNKFLNKLKDQCTGKDSADKYLDEASHCTKYKFTNSKYNNKYDYAFKHTPKDFKQACKCEAPDPLDNCPENDQHIEACKDLSKTNECRKKYYNTDNNSWTPYKIKTSEGKNKVILVPPRRTYLCLRNITSYLSSIKTKEDFKKNLIQSAFTEAYFLSEKYNDQEKAIQAMKYSFADYGDIVKGTDMMDNLKNLKEQLDVLLKNNDGGNNISHDRDKWWNDNKNHIWHAMLCGYKTQTGYKSLNSSWCALPQEDQTHQFMRWFEEWTESFCTGRKELYDIMVNKCNEAHCDKTTGRLNIHACSNACRDYRNYVWTKKNEYFTQKEEYDNEFKLKNKNEDANVVFRNKYFSRKYDCLFDNFKDNAKWDNPYETLGENLKSKCDCIKTESTTPKVQPVDPTEKKEKDKHPPPLRPKPEVHPPPPVQPPPSDEPFDPTILQTTIPFGIALALGSIAFLFMKIYNQRNHKSTTHHTLKIPITRLLCECELYTPANYDDDPQMKKVMKNFNRQTQQRFHEYDERMKTTRQKCKDKCDKEIQKIILKDKLEKELMDKFATLQTDIQSDAIPTCVCEKSVADKVEKGCLKCGSILGSAMPEVGSIGGSLLYALDAWKVAALKAAIAAAKEAGDAAGVAAGEAKGMQIVIGVLEQRGVGLLCPELLKSIGDTIHYTNAGKISDIIYGKYTTTCMGLNNSGPPTACKSFNIKFRLFDTRDIPIGSPPAQAIPESIGYAVDEATRSANAQAAKVAATKTAAIEAAQEKAIETTFMGNQTIIIASVIAIVVIVLIMVIIYLILRYRRKKKMKKKLQYIKLLEE